MNLAGLLLLNFRLIAFVHYNNSIENNDFYTLYYFEEGRNSIAKEV